MVRKLPRGRPSLRIVHDMRQKNSVRCYWQEGGRLSKVSAIIPSRARRTAHSEMEIMTRQLQVNYQCQVLDLYNCLLCGSDLQAQVLRRRVVRT